MSLKNRLALLAAVHLLAAAGMARAEPPAFSAADQQCTACHAEAIGASAFAGSVHAGAGCVACHSDVDPAKHPGNVGAMKAVERPGAIAAQACGGCHSDAVPRHQTWLPNAGHHLEVIACAGCHAPGAKRRVDLRLRDAKSKQELVLRVEPGAVVGERHGQALDAGALRSLVDRARGGAGGAVMVVGRVEVPSAAEAHRLAPKDKSIRECATCHRKGSETFQQVGLSLIGPDGQRTRYQVDPAVLHGPASLDAVRGFYALGGTRIGALDVLLGLAMLGGISAPLGHALVRKLMRRKGGDHA